jgi:hypothetical protein
MALASLRSACMRIRITAALAAKGQIGQPAEMNGEAGKEHQNSLQMVRILANPNP